MRTPKLRRHATGQGFVRLNGRQIYLGRYDLPETREAYHRVLAEWLANSRQPPPRRQSVTVLELIAAYWTHALAYYRQPDGTPTGEAGNIRYAMRPVKDLYGLTGADDFGPNALRAVRQCLVDRGLARTSINQHVGRVKRMFRWAAEREIVPGETWHALQAVSGLRMGRSAARETTPVKPVEAADLAAARDHAGRIVGAMIDLQLLTACRPGEIVMMKPEDLDRAAPIWTYSPAHHKTAWHGHARTIYLGPRAQEVLRPFLFRKPDAFCFSPAEADRERRQALTARRVTPLSCGNRPGTNRKRRADKRPGAHYTVGTYRQAIRYACEAAGVRAWSPNRLRHTAATRIRREFSLDAARVILGHRSPAVTEVYAEIDRQKALDIIAKIG